MARLSWWIGCLGVFLASTAVLAQDKKLDPLIVSYSSFTGNRAPLWIAKETGLYEKYGLDVKLVSIAAGSVSLTSRRIPPPALSARWRAARPWSRFPLTAFSPTN